MFCHDSKMKDIYCHLEEVKEKEACLVFQEQSNTTIYIMSPIISKIKTLSIWENLLVGLGSAADSGTISLASYAIKPIFKQTKIYCACSEWVCPANSSIHRFVNTNDARWQVHKLFLLQVPLVECN